MKIALKYGLLITLVVVLWVVITKFLFPLAPQSRLNLLAPILFNLAAIIAIYLGIKESNQGQLLNFRESLKAGIQISLVYAVSASLFFFILFLIKGPTMLGNEPMAANYPLWQVAVMAYMGLFFGALVFGLIYSTLISFLIVRARK